MIPLATTQRVMTWFCVCPPEEIVPEWKDIAYKFAYKVITFILAASLLSNFLASFIFFWRFVFHDLEKAFYIVWQAPSSFSTFYVLIIAIATRHKINAIFKTLAKIYRANANNDASQFLERANNLSEWIWRIYFKCVFYIHLFGTVIFIAAVFYVWFLSDHIERTYVYNTLLFMFPWKQSSFFGYLSELIFSYFYGVTYFIVNGSFLLLFLSICQHHMAFYEMFRRSAQQLDQIDKRRNNKQCLCNLIRFHRSIKRWFLKTADVYSSYITINFFCSIIILASTAFQLDMQSQHVQFGFYIVISAAAGALANLFVYCVFGMLATESYEKMSESLYDVNWQDLPVDLQKYFFIMIMNMQRPLFYHGFGFYVLKLETFAAILKMVATYYMMFKTLTYQ